MQVVAGCGNVSFPSFLFWSPGLKEEFPADQSCGSAFTVINLTLAYANAIRLLLPEPGLLERTPPTMTFEIANVHFLNFMAINAYKAEITNCYCFIKVKFHATVKIR